MTTPGLYKVKCESRVQDVINEAGGITDNGDTSILNLSKKVSDEMVIIVYSKEEMADITINEDITNITITKEEEHTKIESCDNKTEIKNDACITKDNLLDSIIENNDNTNSEIIGDTPVKVLVSINTASKEELMTLSGIGESKANNIINYRNEVGRFNSIDEIKNVKGIGDSIFEKIKDSITV